MLFDILLRNASDMYIDHPRRSRIADQLQRAIIETGANRRSIYWSQQWLNDLDVFKIHYAYWSQDNIIADHYSTAFSECKGKH